MTPVVVVVGSVNVDLVLTVARLPRPGETVIGGTFARHGGGKGANQAVAAARLGARTYLVGLIGDDDFGRAARQELEAEGVGTQWLGTGDAPTGVASIVVDEAGENCIAVASGANSALDRARVLHALAAVPDTDAVVVTSFEVPEEAVLAAAEGAHSRGWPLVVNPAPARPLPGGLLPRTALLTPNEHEVGVLATDPVDLLQQGLAALAVTCGAAGVDVRTASEAWHQPAFGVEVVDTTGAGDAFTAAAATALARGHDLRDAMKIAAAAGALTTQGRGARSSPRSQAVAELLATRTTVPST